MSYISGIFNRDGSPVDPQRLGTITLLSHGPDRGAGSWSEGQIALSQTSFHPAGDSCSEVKPFQFRDTRFAITANVRLDNREDLFQTLDIPHNKLENISDSELIVNAYQRWGETCPEHFLGDWAFALWDKNEQTLFLSRDHLGHASLYYYETPRIFVFASSIKTMLHYPGVSPQLNTVALAQLAPGGKRDSSTFYQNIFQLGPGRTMRVSREKSQCCYHWHPKNIKDIRFSSDQAYVDAFLDIFNTAVTCRLRGPGDVGVLLSGGLDSGSVASLAARSLALEEKRLTAFSWRPKYDVSETVLKQRMGDEHLYVNRLCDFAGNIDVFFSRADEMGPLAAIESILDILGEPVYSQAVTYWLLDLMDAARQKNIGILLHGIWGNITASWQGPCPQGQMGLLSPMRWASFIRDIIDGKKLNIPNRIMMKSKKKRFRGYARGLIRSEMAGPVLADSSMTDPDLAERQKKAPQPLRSIYNMFQSGSLGTTSELGAAFGLELRSPMTDKRVVEFCLGIPGDQFQRQGRTRWLIRRAMEGLMPDDILWNERRGVIGGDIGQRYREDLNKMESHLAGIQSSSLARQWLDLPRMQAIFESMKQKLDPSIQTDLMLLLRGLMVGRFLERFEDG